ncbi:MAG TPA: DUF1588 domain-containing protein [Polyangiaceae bacterium]|nr:DUF1588 domain-containing protein [Polyangiaceae bacterium]
MRSGLTGVGLCLLAAVGLALTSCKVSEDSDADPPEIERTRELLSPTQHLVRISTVLRGKRPSLSELRQVHEEPSALGGIVDQYLQSPEFGETLRELHNESLQVRVAAGIYPAGFPARGALAGFSSQEVNVAITEAPLRLIQWVVEHERPYSEIVTAPYTVANDIVATAWGITLDRASGGWHTGQYDDGRPHAGILSDSMLFTRHSTTYANSNRGRANAVARSLLCYDFLAREISVDASINLADPKEVANAVRVNAACASCHQTLDPLASFFGAFHPVFLPSDIQSYPFPHYLPALNSAFTSTESAYFGHKGQGLAFLGSMIAADPRFSLCAAQRFYAYLNHVNLRDVPHARAAELQTLFVRSKLNAKALTRAIVLSDDFRHADSDETAEAPIHGVRKVRPSELSRLVEDLTAFRWTANLDVDIGSGNIGRIDLLSDSLFGFEVLLGGIDSVNVTLPAHSMNASASLVLRGIASRAAPYVVQRDLDNPDVEQRKLLGAVSATESAEARIRAQLCDLHLRLYGEFLEPADPAIDGSYALFQDALTAAAGDVRRAWSTTLFALLQDVRLAHF